MEGTALRTEPTRFDWKLSLYAVGCAAAVMLALFVYADDPALTYIFLIVPVACLGLCFLTVAVIVIALLRKRPRRSLSILFAVCVFTLVSGLLLPAGRVIRPSLRWLLWSHRLKAEVLAQPVNGEFRHIEWDGGGGAPVGDWTVYVVFDPTDSLSIAAKSRWAPGYDRYKGIPCGVQSVRRLEEHWYSVTLGMNEWWDRCS